MLTQILFSFLLSFYGILHPLHVSVGTINYSEKEQSLQITVKIFADDLEDELNETVREETDKTYLDVLNPGDPEKLETYLEKYVRDHFKVKLNGKTVRMSYLGHEQESMAIWCYLEVTGVKSIKEIEVEDTIMMRRFSDQMNIVHIDYKDGVKSLRLNEDLPADKVVY